MSENKDTRTAGQKIEDLERVVAMLYQSVGSLDGAVKSLLRTQNDVGLMRDALQLLNKKAEAIIQAANPESGITTAAVSALVIQMNIADLKAQVEGYLARGNLTPTDEVAANSYVICEEYDLDGTVANPRIQFRLDSQNAATQEAMIGKKAGDSVSFGEGKYSAKILEVYTLVDNPPQADAPAATAPDNASAAAAESAPAEAPAAPTQAPQAAATEAYTPPTAGNVPPEESPAAFGLNFHGQPEATLSNQAAPEAPSQN